MGTLFVVGTPIGNRGDITERAISTLAACTLIAAEDTRHSGQLLRGLGITTPMISLNEHNLSTRLGAILDALQTGDVGLVSDAGTPTINDPGFQVVDAVLLAGGMVRAVPGPSAVTTALSVSGIAGSPFTFGGYAPRTGGERREWFARWLATRATFVFFESPNRITRSLVDLDSVAPDATIAICRELTKIHEHVWRGTAAQAIGAVSAGAIPAKGEFVVIVAAIAESTSPVDADALLIAELARGIRPTDAARAVAAKTSLPRSDLYRRALELREPKG